MSEDTKGLATLVCWGCHSEAGNVPGQMDEESLFLADETFKCSFCETEDDYAWSDFEESA